MTACTSWSAYIVDSTIIPIRCRDVDASILVFLPIVERGRAPDDVDRTVRVGRGADADGTEAQIHRLLLLPERRRRRAMRWPAPQSPDIRASCYPSACPIEGGSRDRSPSSYQYNQPNQSIGRGRTLEIEVSMLSDGERGFL